MTSVMRTLLLVLLIAVEASSVRRSFDDDYLPHNYTTNKDFQSLMYKTMEMLPKRTKLYKMGNTAQNNAIWALEIAEHPGVTSPTKYRVGLLANMHGNEITGREILAWFIKRYRAALTDAADPEHRMYAQLLKDADIFILPTINPDGFDRAHELRLRYPNRGIWRAGRGVCQVGAKNRRGQCYEIDMNRDFPPVTQDYYDTRFTHFNHTHHKSRDSTVAGHRFKAQETRIVNEFFGTFPLDYALSFHDGTTVVNYPFDYSPDHHICENWIGNCKVAQSPDHVTFKKLATKLATHWKKERSCKAKNSRNGVVNGANWYSIRGGMQDYHYLVHGTLHMTVEVSCVKFPAVNDLPRILRDDGNIRNLVDWLQFVTNRSQKSSKWLPKIYGTAKFAAGKRVTLRNTETRKAVSTVVKRDGTWSKILTGPGKYRVTLGDKNFKPVRLAARVQEVIVG